MKERKEKSGRRKYRHRGGPFYGTLHGVIDAQEFLKAYGREQKRNLIDEHGGGAHAGTSPREFSP